VGLDMYLTAEVYVTEYFNEDLYTKLNESHATRLHGILPKELSYEVGSWRKANAIHAWFVKNVQAGLDNCEKSSVSTEQLCELKELCEKVVADLELSEMLLPAESGFFFGSTAYDEYYLSYIKDTITIVEQALLFKSSAEIYYQSSW
tara:strand:+ start:7663 stop:8103 length:441 start_codon:yes stop_codon:yes gene_type:complete